ncbi:hypothetical protein LX73_1247 [Fodinibius salinus]|uniref:Uncharacterized protein n=1 Tax=Fodinibius salinus TaxID=860790 RepID=A0A5D3YLH6_9BACT|nr:hypothetical protein [Fodinibius salinus]TYP93541.1 hypothetical protein LX73_1247 [Fodinibius salinus]
MRELIEGQDYQIVDDGMGDLNSYLRQTGRNAFKKAIGLADRALSGRKGQAATTALVLADLTKDKRSFQQVFNRNADVINRYFEHVDLQAVSDMIGIQNAVAKSKPVSIIKQTGIFSVGIALGIAGLTLYNRKRS